VGEGGKLRVRSLGDTRGRDAASGPSPTLGSVFKHRAESVISRRSVGDNFHSAALNPALSRCFRTARRNDSSAKRASLSCPTPLGSSATAAAAAAAAAAARVRLSR